MACWFCFAYVGEVAALHLGRQGETSLARASPLPETVLGGWCEFCLEERRKKRRMAPVHAQHHKPNPLLPAVNLQLEADSWCLVGVVCCLCCHSFFHILLTLCFSSLFTYLDLGPFLLAILLERWKRVIKEVFICWESILRCDNVVWFLRACTWQNFLDTPLALLMEYLFDFLRVHLNWVWRGYDCGRKPLFGKLMSWDCAQSCLMGNLWIFACLWRWHEHNEHQNVRALRALHLFATCRGKGGMSGGSIGKAFATSWLFVLGLLVWYLDLRCRRVVTLIVAGRCCQRSFELDFGWRDWI